MNDLGQVLVNRPSQKILDQDTDLIDRMKIIGLHNSIFPVPEFSSHRHSFPTQPFFSFPAVPKVFESRPLPSLFGEVDREARIVILKDFLYVFTTGADDIAPSRSKKSLMPAGCP